MTEAETHAEGATLLPSEIRVYVNERGVSIPRGASALDAVRAHSEHDARELQAGRARLTDSRGLPMTPDAVLNGGAIMRVLPVRERAATPEVAGSDNSHADGAE